MRFLFVLTCALLIAGPAAAMPQLVVLALGGAAVLGTVGVALVQIVVGLAISAVGQALQAKRRRSASQRSDGGIRTDVTTNGGVTPQSFILGRYATAGNITAPFYAHSIPGSVSNAFRTQIIDLSDVPVSGLHEVWIDGRSFPVATAFNGLAHPDYGMSVNPSTQARYAGKVWLKFYDGTQTVADPMLVAKYGSHPQRPWTSAMIGRGVAYAILTFFYDTTLFKAEPQCLFVVDGIKLYDWRKDGTAGGVGAHRWANQATWEFTENPVVMDYNIKRGLPLPDGDTYGMGVAALDLPIAWWTAAANVADQTVSSLPRYRAGYEVRMATAEDGGDTPLDISDELMLSCAGALCDFGGTWIIRAGEVSLPVAAITDDDILRNKPQELDQFKGMAQTFNAVRASYPEPNQQWRPREAPPRYDAAAETEDGQRLVANLTLPAAPFGPQVQRLMRAWLKDARRMRQHSITLPADYSYLTPLDCIEWASVRNGYTAKLFDLGEVAIDPRTLSLTLSAREVDPADYSWTAGDELAVGAPSPTILEHPIDQVPGFNATAFTLLDTAGQPRRPAILLTWSTDLPGVLALRYQIRLLSTGVIVTNGSTATLQDGQEVITQGILPNQTYQARAQLQSNRLTGWTAWISVTTPNVGFTVPDFDPGLVGAFDTTPPPVPLGLTVTSTANGDGTSRIVATVTPSVAGDFAEHEFQIRETTGGNYTGFKSALSRQEWVRVSGVSYTVQAAASDKNANQSAFCTAVVHVAAADAIAPPAQTLSVSTGYGVAWLTTAVSAAADFDHFDIFRQATATPVPSAGTTASFSSPSNLMSDLMAVGSTVYYWLRVVDKSGNKSAWSAVQTAVAPITAVVTAAALAGLIDQTAMAAGQAIIQLVTTLPAGPHGPREGQYVQLQTDGKLYRNDGTGWKKTVDGADVIANTITGASVVAGTLTAREVAARSLTTLEMSIRDFQNRMEEPGAEAGGTGWVGLGAVAGDWDITTTFPRTGLNSFRRSYTGAASNNFKSNIMKFPVEAGNVYYGKFFGRQGAGFAGGDVGFRVVWLNAAGGVITNSPIAAPIIGGTYAMVTGTVTAPALAVEAVVHLYSLAQTAGTVYIDDLFLAEMNAGDLIVDGRIRANHLDTTSAVITGTAQIGDAIITSAKILGTLAASKLDIATRNVSLTGLLFDFNAPAANRCSWTAGSARWINDAGAVTSVAIAAGSTAVWTTGVIYIYWVQGATTLSTTTVAATAFASGNLVVATYLGGNLVNASFGSRTVIDGPNIKAASVTAAQGIFAALAVKTIDLAVGAVSQLVIIASVSAFVDSSAVYNNTYTADGAYVALGVAGAGFQLAHTLTYTISSDPDFKPEKFQVQIRAILDQTTWTNTTATGTKYISLASVFVLIKKNGVYFPRTSFDFMYVKTEGISVYETKVTEDSRDGTFTSASYASGDVFTFEFYLYKFRTTGSAIAFMENVTKSSISIVEYLK